MNLPDTLSDLVKEGSNQLDKMNAAYYKMRQRKLFKISCALLAMIMVTSYGMFLYFHNKHYSRVTYDIHQIGERVDLGNNYIEIYPTREESVYSDGYFVTLTNPYMQNFSDFIKENTEDKKYSLFGGSVSDSDAITVDGYQEIMNFFGGRDANNAPKKIITVDALFENVSREENWETGIPIEDIRLTGIDWYADGDFILSNIINGTDVMSAAPGTQTQMKLMFPIYDSHLDLDKMEQEEIYISFTVAPTIVRIRLGL